MPRFLLPLSLTFSALVLSALLLHLASSKTCDEVNGILVTFNQTVQGPDRWVNGKVTAPATFQRSYCVKGHPECSAEFADGAVCPLYMTANTDHVFFSRVDDPATNGKFVTVERYNAMDRNEEPDDFMAEMLNRLSRQWRIDAERVYLLGWSAGAASLSRGACYDWSPYGTMTDVFAANVQMGGCGGCGDGWKQADGNFHYLALNGADDVFCTDGGLATGKIFVNNSAQCSNLAGNWCSIQPNDKYSPQANPVDKAEKLTFGNCANGDVMFYRFYGQAHDVSYGTYFNPKLSGYDIAWNWFQGRTKHGGLFGNGGDCGGISQKASQPQPAPKLLVRTNNYCGLEGQTETIPILNGQTGRRCVNNSWVNEAVISCDTNFVSNGTHCLCNLTNGCAPVVSETISLDIVTLTFVGGANDQAITEVAWQDDCTLIAKGQGFNVTYSADGATFIRSAGDLNANSTSALGTNFAAGNSYSVPNPDDPKGGFYRIFYEQLGSIHQQPRLNYYNDTKNITNPGALFRWWRTYYYSAITNTAVVRGSQGDTRGVDIVPLAKNRFIARIWGDGGLANIRDPRNLMAQNLACQSCNSKGSMFIVGQNPTVFAYNDHPLPLFARSIGFRPQKFLADNDARIYITEGVADPLGLGGDGACGITVYDQGLQAKLFEAKFGCNTIYSIAIKDDLLAVGGRITQAQASALQSKLKNPSQNGFGGGLYDGFFAVFKINVNGSCAVPREGPRASNCYCSGPEVSNFNQCIERCVTYPDFTWIEKDQNPGRGPCGSHVNFGATGFPGTNSNIRASRTPSGCSVPTSYAVTYSTPPSKTAAPPIYPSNTPPPPPTSGSSTGPSSSGSSTGSNGLSGDASVQSLAFGAFVLALLVALF